MADANGKPMRTTSGSRTSARTSPNSTDRPVTEPRNRTSPFSMRAGTGPCDGPSRPATRFPALVEDRGQQHMRSDLTKSPRAEVDAGLPTPCPQRLYGSRGPAPWTRRGQPRQRRCRRPDGGSARVARGQFPSSRCRLIGSSGTTRTGTATRTAAHRSQACRNIALFHAGGPSMRRPMSSGDADAVNGN